MTDSSLATDALSEALTNITLQNQSQLESIESTASSVEEIARNIEQLNQTIHNQAANVTESSAAVEEMVSSIRSIGDNVKEIERRFGLLTDSTFKGREKLNSVTERAEQVSAQSESLMEAALVISQIAAQTNLLSMNAAIEAAHAGDYGKGFAVVAEEIRKLAEMSSQHSKTISTSLKEMKKSIENIPPTAYDASEAFSAVQSEVEELNNLVVQVHHALEEQTVGSREIGEALARMNDITVIVRDGSQEMHAGNDSILSDITNLRRISEEVTREIKRTDESSNHISGSILAVNNAMEQVNEALNYALDAFSLEDNHLD